jgi:transcriptional regulator with XRE-family HTH domain
MKKIEENVNINKGLGKTQDDNDMQESNNSLDIRQLIRNICRDQKITSRNLCMNICSESYFSEFLKNQKSINKITIDFLLQRLGLSEGNFEYYLSPKETKNLNTHYKIIELIERKDIISAENAIEEYERTIKISDKLNIRFILLMKARISFLKNESSEKIYLSLKEAVEITIPKFENKAFDRFLLSYNELFFIIECISYKEKMYIDKKLDNEQCQQQYYKIIKYIEKRNFDDIIKAKLYSKVVCLFAKKQLLSKKYELVLEVCNKAMEYLRKSQKLYSIEDIMEYIGLALEGIINSSENDLVSFKKQYNENNKQRNCILELFQEFNLNKEPYEWYPLNNSRELYSIGEIVQLRRKMFKMSKTRLAKLSGTTSRTISRIEDGETSPYSEVIKEIFANLGILGEYQSYVFDCDNYKAYKLEKELTNSLILGEYEKGFKIFKQFKNCIDVSSKLNKQYIGHKETSILRKLKLIEDKEAIDRFIEALELTLPIDSVFDNTKKHFTKKEIMLILNIGIIYKDLKDYENAIKWLKWCESYYNDLDYDLSTYIITFGLVMTIYESLLGDIGHYDKSDDVAKRVIYECLKCRRGNLIAGCIYSSAWNLKEKIQKNNKKMQTNQLALYKNKLEKALMISYIMDEKIMINFLSKKLDDFSISYS